MPLFVPSAPPRVRLVRLGFAFSQPSGTLSYPCSKRAKNRLRNSTTEGRSTKELLFRPDKPMPATYRTRFDQPALTISSSLVASDDERELLEPPGARAQDE